MSKKIKTIKTTVEEFYKLEHGIEESFDSFGRMLLFDLSKYGTFTRSGLEDKMVKSELDIMIILEETKEELIAKILDVFRNHHPEIN